MSDDNTIPKIMVDYLNGYRTNNEIYWWAWEKVNAMTSPEHLPFLCELIESCGNEQEIAYVAAGPLEALFNHHYVEINNNLDQMVRKSKKMRQAIQGLFFCQNTPQRHALDNLLRQYGLMYGSL